MKKELSNYVADYVEGCTPEQVFHLIEVPPDEAMERLSVWITHHQTSLKISMWDIFELLL